MVLQQEQREVSTSTRWLGRHGLWTNSASAIRAVPSVCALSGEMHGVTSITKAGNSMSDVSVWWCQRTEPQGRSIVSDASVCGTTTSTKRMQERRERWRLTCRCADHVDRSCGLWLVP